MITDILKILLLEDSDADAEMIQHQLKRDGLNCQFKVVMTKAAYVQALVEFKPDLILSDNEMPQFSGWEALEILQQYALNIPFILVTGTSSEEFVAGIIKAGADDYLLKDRLTRLPAAMEAALKQKQTEKEKQQAEEQLAQSEKRFRALVENNDAIISLLDENLVTTFRSSSAERITGWTNAEFASVNIKDYIHPDDIEKMQGIIADALANPEKALPVKLRVRHKSGHYIWLEGVINNSLHDPGVKGVISNLRDITERVEAEQKIIKANRLYAFISQINQMIVRTTDEKTLFAEACHIAVNIGKFKMAWIGIIDEQNQKVVPLVFAGEERKYLTKIKIISVNDVPEGRSPTGTAIRQGKYIICNDIENDPQMASWKEAALERGYLSSMAIPIRKFGKVIGAFSFYASEKNFFDAAEITLLQEAVGDVAFALEIFEKEALRKKAEEAVAESEQRYHTLTETSPVGIFHTDVAGNTTYVNPCWCRISGLSYAEALGDGWLSAVHSEDRNVLKAGWQNTREKITLSEYRFVHPDGTIVWVMGQATPEMNSKNQLVGYVGTVTDITEHKMAEDFIFKEKELSDTLINNLPGIFYLYDDAGNFVRWNKNFENVTEFTGEEISKMHPVDFYAEDEKQKISTRIKTVFEKKSSGIEVEICTKSKNKIPYYINSVAMVYKGKQCLLGMGLDLSERKKAEDEIKKANERYELIGKATNDGVWDWDVKTGKVWSNEMHQRLYGLTMADPVPGNSEWIKRVHPADREQTIKKFEEAKVSACNSFVDEYRFLSRDTAYINVFSRILIERDKLGKPSRLIGSMMDITESKKAEEAIKASEEKYRVLVEEASEGIFISDSTGRFITVNASACRMAQYTEEELLQMSVYDFFTDDDVKKRPLQFEDLRRGKTVVSERVMKRKDGHLNYLEITSKLLSDGRLLSLVRDVAERKKAEESIRLSNERYNLVAKATNDSIWELNIITGAITRTGDGFTTLFGYDNKSGINSDPAFSQLVHPEDSLQVSESMLAVFNNPDAFYWGKEYRLLKANGEYAHVYDKGYIIRDEYGKAIRMIGATQDITKLKENEIHLRKLNQSLQTQTTDLAYSNAELEQFAYVASHDLQEPLRMVTSFLTLVENQYGNVIDDKGKKYIHFAVDGAKRMRQIILDLLQISRVGQSEGNLEPVDLNVLVKEITMIFQKQITEKKAFIDVGELPVIHAYKPSIEQVFQNLIGNAIKYKRKNIPAQITISAIAVNEYWQFSVTDNGIGIEEEYFDKIFVIFQRLHLKNEFSGTGIGLAITKKIIENSGGKIWLTSEPGKGSTFYFTIKK